MVSKNLYETNKNKNNIVQINFFRIQLVKVAVGGKLHRTGGKTHLPHEL
jgi:hypothetical protein